MTLNSFCVFVKAFHFIFPPRALSPHVCAGGTCKKRRLVLIMIMLEVRALVLSCYYQHTSSRYAVRA